MLTIAAREIDHGEETLVVVRNGEKEANQLYRQFRVWRSAGGAVIMTIRPREDGLRKETPGSVQIAKRSQFAFTNVHSLEQRD